jgi:hypothetical protein
MSYLESERRRIIKLRDELFNDPGQGMFSGKPRDFVLDDAPANLWAGIREDALKYFADNKISWWRGGTDEPTGHLLSSQIACINHLYALRQREDLATAVLHALDAENVRAEKVDHGFVEFEFIGPTQRLRERAFSRGANCTSVDAFMIGLTATGVRRAVLIEWKYTESYPGDDLYIPARAHVYDDLIAAPDSPFLPLPAGTLYREPFYQLMRQTLLGWLIAKHQDYGCTEFRHVHVVPAANTAFHCKIPTPALPGTTVTAAWRAALRQPERYITTTPEAFLAPAASLPDTASLTAYLRSRYWAGG